MNPLIWQEIGAGIIRVFGSYPFQLLLAVHLFAYPTFRRRPHFWLRAILLALPVPILFDLCVRLFPAGILHPFPVLDRALLLVPTAYNFCMLLLCYRCTPREALFSSTCSMPVQNAVFNLFWILKTLLGFDEYGLVSLVVSWSLMAVVYGIVYAFFRRWMDDREGHTLPRFRVIQNAVVIIAFVIFFNRRAEGSEWEIYIYLAYIFADILALLMQIGLISETNIALKYSIMEQLLSSEQKKQRMTAENVDLINRKCHDLKHQIEGLKRMKSEKERSEYIGQIEDAVLFYESAAKTGNETLDLILMEKQLYCKAHEISLTCICDGTPLHTLDTMDLYSLFGNALDNAIEAVEHEPVENRRIDLRVGQRGSFLTVHVENYLGQSLRVVDGLPVTTKEDRNYHGFGVLSIRHVVQKYGGTMTVRTDDSRFRLDILIPL